MVRAVVPDEPDHVALAAQRQPRRIICFELTAGGRYPTWPEKVVDRSVPEQALKTPCQTPVEPIVREEQRRASERHLRDEAGPEIIAQAIANLNHIVDRRPAPVARHLPARTELDLNRLTGRGHGAGDTEERPLALMLDASHIR
jgi:hypothetical protein